jgi:hypothetical protein
MQKYYVYPKLSKFETPQTLINTGFKYYSLRPELCWDVRRDTQIFEVDPIVKTTKLEK